MRPPSTALLREEISDLTRSDAINAFLAQCQQTVDKSSRNVTILGSLLAISITFNAIFFLYMVRGLQ